LLSETLRSSLAPGRAQRFGKRRFAGGFQIHAGCTAPSPGAFHRQENFRLGFRKIVLLLGMEVDHTPSRGGMAERGENFPADPEIGMGHVRALDRFGQGKSQAAKVVGGHFQSLPVEVICTDRITVDRPRKLRWRGGRLRP